MDIRKIFKKPKEVAGLLGLGVDDQPESVILIIWMTANNDSEGEILYGSVRVVFKNGSWADYNTPVIPNLAWSQNTYQEFEELEFEMSIQEIIDIAISKRIFSTQYKG